LNPDLLIQKLAPRNCLEPKDFMIVWLDWIPITGKSSPIHGRKSFFLSNAGPVSTVLERSASIR